MRYVALALTLVLLLFAMPLAASWWPGFSTTNVQLNVGEKTIVTVTPMWSGLVDYGGGVHWSFDTDNPTVAIGNVRLDDPTPRPFAIIGMSPGIAHIRGNGGWSYVLIQVTCGPENPAIAAQPVIGVQLGQSAHLAVVTEYENRSTFRWYLGKIGDTTHPIDRSSPDAFYTPTSLESRYIWAEVTTACSVSHVQFRVDAYVPRRRSVVH